MDQENENSIDHHRDSICAGVVRYADPGDHRGRDRVAAVRINDSDFDDDGDQTGISWPQAFTVFYVIDHFRDRDD